LGLMEEISSEQYAAAMRQVKCRIGLALTSFEGDDKIDLIAALDNPEVQHSAIARALTKHGVRVGYSAVSNHRRGLCGCSR